MGIPVFQKINVGYYAISQLLLRRSKFALVLMLEPLYRCNLSCRGCGKLKLAEKAPADHLSVDECIAAAEECKAPIVSIAGGEPLLHPQIDRIVEQLIDRRRFIYLCTNALLVEKRINRFEPSPFLTFNIHIDGLRERHDAMVGLSGVFDQAVAAIRLLIDKGYRVTTNTTLFCDETPENAAGLFDFLSSLGVEAMTVAPAYNFETASDQDHFPDRQKTYDLFSHIFEIGRRKKWNFNHSSLYLDFLAGKRPLKCSPWGTPARNLFGWQRPCYLLDEGYAETYEDLINKTDWSAYGSDRNPKCASCMVHCGFEPTAVVDSIKNPLQLIDFSKANNNKRAAG